VELLFLLKVVFGRAEKGGRLFDGRTCLFPAGRDGETGL